MIIASLIILFLPLLAFIVQIFFGQRLPRKGDFVSIFAVLITLGVALGMLVACEIARQLKLITAKTVERIEALITKAGLPNKISGLKLKDILKAQAHDKKFRNGKNRFVLPVKIGKVVVRENISEHVIVQAIKSRFD